MGDPEKKKKPTDYEDFIIARPDPILFLSEEQEAVIKEHSDITRALVGKNLSVKEIHALYWNPEKEEYDKTIKTVYRYLETLEEVGLVQECGHRKPKDSRLTEKLFCRTANVFILEDKEGEPKWWTGEKGERIIKKLTTLLQELFDVSIDEEAFRKLMEQYYEQHENVIMELYRKTPERKGISEIFSKEDLYGIKYLADMVSTLGVMLRNPELCEQFKKVLSK
ncbi:MAG: hypothetical protein ACFFAL_01935 [Promethearchaeota archaeon]